MTSKSEESSSSLRASVDNSVPWEPYRAAVTRPENSSSATKNPKNGSKRVSFFRTIPSRDSKEGLAENGADNVKIPYKIKTIIKKKHGRKSEQSQELNGKYPQDNNSFGSNASLDTSYQPSIADSSSTERESVVQNGNEFSSPHRNGHSQIENRQEFTTNTAGHSERDLAEKYEQLRIDYEKMAVENLCLKKELGIHADVNAELKRLVVASMGEDLQSHLDSLSNDKVRLAQEVVNYGKQLSQGHETVESLAIQSDMWRSKYLASSVMVDELIHWRVHLIRKFEEAQSCLLRLMQDHHAYRQHSFQTFLLTRDILEDAIPNENEQAVHKELLKSHTLSDLITVLHSVAVHLHARLAPGKERTNINHNPQRLLTPTESLAESLITLDTSQFYGSSPCKDAKENAAERQARLLGLTAQCQFKNLTINCCSQCAGEIKLV